MLLFQWCLLMVVYIVLMLSQCFMIKNNHILELQYRIRTALLENSFNALVLFAFNDNFLDPRWKSCRFYLVVD